MRWFHRVIACQYVKLWISCECCSRECVCGMSLRPTFVFVDVFMLFKHKLISFQDLHFFNESDANENILE